MKFCTDVQIFPLQFLAAIGWILAIQLFHGRYRYKLYEGQMCLLEQIVRLLLTVSILVITLAQPSHYMAFFSHFSVNKRPYIRITNKLVHVTQLQEKEYQPDQELGDP